MMKVNGLVRPGRGKISLAGEQGCVEGVEEEGWREGGCGGQNEG